MPESTEAALARIDEKLKNLLDGFEEFKRERIKALEDRQKALEDRVGQVERRVWMFSGGLIVANVVSYWLMHSLLK